jgi:hypothetical protein
MRCRAGCSLPACQLHTKLHTPHASPPTYRLYVYTTCSSSFRAGLKLCVSTCCSAIRYANRADTLSAAPLLPALAAGAPGGASCGCCCCGCCSLRCAACAWSRRSRTTWQWLTRRSSASRNRQNSASVKSLLGGGTNREATGRMAGSRRTPYREPGSVGRDHVIHVAGHKLHQHDRQLCKTAAGCQAQ